MQDTRRSSSRFAAIAAFSVLLCLQGVAIAQAVTMDGIVQSVNRRLNYVTARDQATGRDVRIDVRRMDTRGSVDVWQLRTGDRIVVDGAWENRDTFQADRVTIMRSQPHGGAFGSANGLTGVLQSSNRRLNYLVVRDEATGRDVRVDVRRMDTVQSVNVWQLRPGDRIVVDGGWENRDTFQADRVNPAHQRRNRERGVLNGVVQSVNRHLNYIMVRDDASRRLIKIDVREMNTSQSLNVWRLRSGDRIVVNGGWEDRDTFQAETVNPSY